MAKSTSCERGRQSGDRRVRRGGFPFAARLFLVQIPYVNTTRILWDAADAWADRIAVRDDAQCLTYGALASRASAVGDALMACGVRTGDRVCTLLPHGVDAAAAIYGAAATGASVAVLNWLSRPRQVEFALRHTGASVLVASRSWQGQQVRALDATVPVLYVEDLPAAGRLLPVARVDTDLAQICFTSGSTGAPKGVAITHANLHAGIRTVVDYLGIVRDDRIASLLPFSSVYGFNQLNCAIATGATLEIMSSVIAPDVVRALAERECSVLAAVPPLWMQFLNVGEFRQSLPRLRLLTCAGGRLSPDSVRALRSAQPQARLFLMYGLTEVFRSTFLPPEEVDAHPDSMGRSVPDSRVFVVREDGTECADDEVGELVHAGPTVAAGYWNDPEATAKTFRPNPFSPDFAGPLGRAVFSGDLVRRDGAGRLYYVGRRDRMIKTRGYRVSPDEIVDVLLASRLLVDAAVTSEPDPRSGDRIVAHVVLGSGATLEALRRWGGAELPRYMLPARWDVREVLPRTASGKHDLVALAGKAALG